MLKHLLEILKNRAKVGGINFLLEMTIGILTEWQRANQAGTFDAHRQKSPFTEDLNNNNNQVSH